MILLLDTQALFWWLTDDGKLSKPARAAIGDADSDVLVSAVSAFEIANKVRSGKWPEAAMLCPILADVIHEQRFGVAPLRVDHAMLAGQLPHPHRDPFDRMLAAQSILDGATLVSSDAVLAELGAELLW